MSNTLLITGGTVITNDSSAPLIKDGAVFIRGNIIEDVGGAAALKEKYGDAPYMDAGGKLVMSGFINCHTHYYSTFARGLNLNSKPSTTFGEVLRSLWWRLDKALTLDDVYYSCIPAMIEQVRCGVTSAIDHHASPFAARGSLFKIAEAAEHCGIRSNLCYEVSDRDGEKIKDDGLKENIEFIKHCKAKDSDMLRALFGLHASLTVSQNTLEAAIAQVQALDTGFHIHAAEGIEDVVDSLAKYNMRVIERLYNNKMLNKKSLAVHCVQITKEEITLLAESGVAVVHNPESNMGNAVGASPVLEMIERGVLVGMGTDAYTHDMTESLKVCALIHKHEARCPSAAWAEPPLMLFKNNKEIFNRFIKGKTGSLTKGSYADIIIVDYKPPTPLEEGNINSHILFGIGGHQVLTTIVNGAVLMKDRVLVNIDEEALLARSREAAKKLWARI